MEPEQLSLDDELLAAAEIAANPQSAADLEEPSVEADDGTWEWWFYNVAKQETS